MEKEELGEKQKIEVGRYKYLDRIYGILAGVALMLWLLTLGHFLNSATENVLNTIAVVLVVIIALIGTVLKGKMYNMAFERKKETGSFVPPNTPEKTKRLIKNASRFMVIVFIIIVITILVSNFIKN